MSALLLVCGVARAERVNLARFQFTTAESVDGGSEALFATDGIVHNGSRWVSANTVNPHWLQVEFPHPVQVGSAHVYSGLDDGSAMVSFQIQYQAGTAWFTAPGGAVAANTSIERNIVFTNPVTAARWRVWTDDNGHVRIKEFALFPPNGPAGYPLGTGVELNLGWLGRALGSSQLPGSPPRYAVDGHVDDGSRWVSEDDPEDDTLEIQFPGGSHKIGSSHIYTGWGNADVVTTFKLQFDNGTAWQDIPGAVVVSNTASVVAVDFTVEVTTDRVRFWAPGTGRKRVKELLVFGANGGAGYPLGTGVSPDPRSERQFTEFDDGYWSLRNEAAGRAAVAPSAGRPLIASPLTPTEDQQYQVLLNVGTHTFRIRNRTTGKALSVVNGARGAGALIVEEEYSGLPFQDWRLLDAGGGLSRIVNEFSGLSLQTLSAGPSPGIPLIQGSYEGGNHQRWLISAETHYPKKGIAGWLGSADEMGAEWGYSWDANDGTLNSGGLRMPMQHNASWPGWSRLPGKYVLYNSRGRQTMLLGFNEPERSDQANMSVAKAIELWPRLERVRIPLVSPAPATYGSWINTFMNQAASQGHQVDYMGVHWYGSPGGGNPQGFIDWLWNIQNTYKRPLWVTEFSCVDWGGSATWTEEDVYDFFAEFLWRAENLGWLNKYSAFLFNGNGPANPWDKTGPRGNFLKSDGNTLTALGELYAAWDGDQEVRDFVPYIIHGKSTRKRPRNDPGMPAPRPGTIRESGASMQWVLAPAPGGRRYLVSASDGRRLGSDGANVAFAAPGTTGPVVEWQPVHKEKGWWFIDHPATGRRLHMRYIPGVSPEGPPTSVEINVTDTRWTDGNVLFRFIQSVTPVPLDPPSTPAGLSAGARTNAVVLTWPINTQPAFTGCDVYRALDPGGGWVRIASRVMVPGFADSNVVAGSRYRYVVRATDWLDRESADAPEASAVPLPATPDTYDHWVLLSFRNQPDADSTPAGNPDGDGLSNLAEYGHGTDPLSSNASPLRAFLDPGVGVLIQFPWNAHATDLDYGLLAVPGLPAADPWPSTGFEVESEIPEADVNRVTLRPGALDAARKFYRLELSPP